jgi:hypothetical protein
MVWNRRFGSFRKQRPIMEYLSGRTLDKVIHRQALPEAKVFSVWYPDRRLAGGRALGRNVR